MVEPVIHPTFLSFLLKYCHVHVLYWHLKTIILRILLLSNLIEVGLAAECIVTEITEIVTEIMNVL